MHGGALAQKASKQKELSDHKLVKASNKRHGGGYSACALDIYIRPPCLQGVWACELVTLLLLN